MTTSKVNLKLNIPTIAPRGSSVFTQALKVCCAAIAFQVENAQFCKVAGESAVTLDIPQAHLQLVDANAIVRYFAEIGSSPWTSQNKLPDAALIEWEERVLAAHLGDLEFVLKQADHLITTSGLAQSTTITPAYIILFATLYDILAAAPSSSLEQYPDLKTWFNRTLDSTWAQEGVQKAATQTTDLKIEDEVTKSVKQPTVKADKTPKKPVVVGTVADRKVDEKTNMKIFPPGVTILPVEGEKNILITSALPYVNNVPHLGNIIGSVLSADAYSRFCKARNYNTLYICGTDEYGTATETKAIEEGVTPRQLCDKYNKIHADVYQWFNIGFDHFGRTTTQAQTDIAQDIFLKLKKNGYLSEQTMEQLYCEKHEAFLADRYVEGTCPRCKYEDARGDQCDACGNLLDPTDLINPRCKLDNATPVMRTTKHTFIDLDRLQPVEEEWFKKSVEAGQWSRNGRIITESWLKEGLKPRCITRDLKWGTPVPLEGYEKKVLYVWFDACIGYPSITANYTKEWEQWWRNPEQVKLYQFLGKDNVPFHSVIFPSSQLGTGDKWTMLHHLSTTEYLQYEGGKFSKSRNVGVFGNNAQDTGIPSDVWRYYLLSSRPESGDAQFIWRDFILKNNTELLANFGNFVNRLIKYTIAKFDGVVPDYTAAISQFDDVKVEIDHLLKDYVNEMESVHLRAGIDKAMAISGRGNQFLQDNKLDNALFASQPEKTAAVVGFGLNLIYLLSAIMYPYMPTSAISICEQLNAPLRRIPDALDFALQPGHRIGKAAYLFSVIDLKNEELWQNKYGGDKKAEEAKKEEDKKKKKAAKKEKKAPAAAGSGNGSGNGNGNNAAAGSDQGTVQGMIDNAGAVVSDAADHIKEKMDQITK